MFAERLRRPRWSPRRSAAQTSWTRSFHAYAPARRSFRASGTLPCPRRTRSWILRSSVCSGRREPDWVVRNLGRREPSGDEEGAAEEDGCTKQPCRGGCFAAEICSVMSSRSWLPVRGPVHQRRVPGRAAEEDLQEPTGLRSVLAIVLGDFRTTSGEAAIHAEAEAPGASTRERIAVN